MEREGRLGQRELVDRAEGIYEKIYEKGRRVGGYMKLCKMKKEKW